MRSVCLAGALEEVADRAVAQQTGARGLLTVLEETLRDFKFELPSTGAPSTDFHATARPQTTTARPRQASLSSS